MRYILLLSLPLLAACSQEAEAPAPQPTTAAVATPAAPTPPAPNQELFTKVFAETCPDAKPVNTAVCKRAGLGSDDVICEFGLGDDTYLRNKATLTAQNAQWSLKDGVQICAKFSS